MSYCKVRLHMSACFVTMRIGLRERDFLPAKFHHLSIESDFDKYVQPTQRPNFEADIAETC